MRVHFIAIGGSVMSQLAIALHKKGYIVSGSDDDIFDPSKGNLRDYQLLPEEMGWHPNKINDTIDAIILGMHAKPDNPELLKAQQLNLKVYSYPEFIYENAKDKKRLVVAGSHGKTTITAMVTHVLSALKMDFDYLIGAKLEGLDSQVKLTKENDWMIIEGDEYLSSPIHPQPKIMYYQPSITCISGIAWDHINVFPTEADYIQQFKNYIQSLSPSCTIIYNEEDTVLKSLVEECRIENEIKAYNTPDFTIKQGQFEIEVNNQIIKLSFFGTHNLQNMACAKLLCTEMGVSEHDFYKHIQHFKGAARRLQLMKSGINWSAYNDFAHAPSKVKASVNAVAELWQNRKLTALLELHTYSSLNATFIEEYKNTLEAANEAVIYFNAHTLSIKRLPDLSVEAVKKVFNHPNLMVFTVKEDLEKYLAKMSFNDRNLLIMTSGNLSGVDVLQYLPS